MTQFTFFNQTKLYSAYSKKINLTVNHQILVQLSLSEQFIAILVSKDIVQIWNSDFEKMIHEIKFKVHKISPIIQPLINNHLAVLVDGVIEIWKIDTNELKKIKSINYPFADDIASVNEGNMLLIFDDFHKKICSLEPFKNDDISEKFDRRKESYKDLKENQVICARYCGEDISIYNLTNRYRMYYFDKCFYDLKEKFPQHWEALTKYRSCHEITAFNKYSETEIIIGYKMGFEIRNLEDGPQRVILNKNDAYLEGISVTNDHIICFYKPIYLDKYKDIDRKNLIIEAYDKENLNLLQKFSYSDGAEIEIMRTLHDGSILLGTENHINIFKFKQPTSQFNLENFSDLNVCTIR